MREKKPKPEKIVQALKKVEETTSVAQETNQDKNKVDLSLVRMRVIQGYRDMKKRKRLESKEEK